MVCGIDIGGTKLQLAVFDRAMNEVHSRRAATPVRDYGAFLDALAALVRSADEIARKTQAVGLAFPGIVGSGGLAISTNIPCIRGRPVMADIQAALARRVVHLNDTRAFALSESRGGALDGAAIGMGVVLGTGVAGALCIGRRLWAGSQGIAGEYGHMPLPRNLLKKYALPQSRCACGTDGCAEAFLSGPGLVRMGIRFGAAGSTAEELLKEAGEVLGALNRSLGNTGVGSSDVGRAVSFVMNNRRVLIVDGSFDTEEVATRLEETGHAVRSVEETDVWSGDAGNVALLGPGRLAMSYDFTTLESALSQLSAGRTLDLVEAAREVLERMGGTAYVSVTTRCESVAPGCQALGFSASGKGGPAGAFDLVSWYTSAAEAEAARRSFQEFVSTEGLFDEATALVEGQSHIAMGEGHPSEIFRGADSEFRLRP